MSTMQRMAPGIFGGDLAMYPSEDGKYVRLDDAMIAPATASEATAAQQEPLSEARIAEIYRDTYPGTWMADGSLRMFARAIEAAHGIAAPANGEETK